MYAMFLLSALSHRASLSLFMHLAKMDGVLQPSSAAYRDPSLCPFAVFGAPSNPNVRVPHGPHRVEY
jgi:hypothetical protein